jgi:hypothetical protein
VSFIDLFSNDQWRDEDVANRRRALLASMVSEARQHELQTILLWHLVGIRTPSADEWAEIESMKQAWIKAAAEYDAAWKDVQLLRRAQAVERGESTAESEPNEVQDLVRARIAWRQEHGIV